MDDGTLFGDQRFREKWADSVAVFDRATSAWNPVVSLPKERLISADGDKLVFLSHHDQLQRVDIGSSLLASH